MACNRTEAFAAGDAGGSGGFDLLAMVDSLLPASTRCVRIGLPHGFVRMGPAGVYRFSHGVLCDRRAETAKISKEVLKWY